MLWVKDKILVTIFSFFNSVFQILLRQGRLKSGLYGKELTHSHLLTPLGNEPFENTVGKGEIARNEQFLLFPQCFLPASITFCHFRQFQNCLLQTFLGWKSLKFVVW